MKIVIIIGPHAVGKMTVGQALEATTELQLFHNHQPIELVLPYFSYGSEMGRGLVHRIRHELFAAFAKSDRAGYILTFVWAFDLPGERDYIESVEKIFADEGADVMFVELEASLNERISRNQSENRLRHKPSKRNIEWSNAHVISEHEQHRLNSLPGEIDREAYLRINTQDLSAAEVALRIQREFALPPR
ncbi:MAG: hypothetical protein ACSHXD_13550 [Marinosulfonomonas sp.]